jgi:hypothetical protein
MSTTIIIVIASIAFSAIIAFVVLKQAGVLGPRKKVLATGTPGTAQVLGVTPTGTVINEINYVCRFALRVQLPGTAPYDVEIKDTVPITAMGAIVPGSVLSVRVDPSDRTKVFIDFAAGVQAAPGMAGMAGPGTSAVPPSTADLATALHDPSVMATTTNGSAADLLRTGQPAQGYLRSFADTGQTPRMLGRQVAPEALDDPLFVLEVELRFGPGATPILGTVIHRVPRAIAPTLFVGMPLVCAVDPGNPTRNFAIDFTATGQPSAAPAAPGASPVAGQQW